MKTKYIAGILFAMTLGWLLWPSEESDVLNDAQTDSREGSQVLAVSLSSAIQPVTGVAQKTNTATAEMKKIVTELRTGELPAQRFKTALKHIGNKQWQEAEVILEDLITHYPLAIESYINLASIYSKTNRLDDARQILNSGINANPNYATLFGNLRSIHSALAAEAYKQAVFEEGDSGINISGISLELPLISSIDTTPVERKRQKDLLGKVSRLQKQISEQKQVSVSQQDVHGQLTLLEAQLANINKQLLDAQEELAGVYAREKVTNEKLLLLESKYSSSLAANESNKIAVEAEQVLITAQQQKKSKDAIKRQESQQQEKLIGLVKNWANAWSKQDVDAYVSYYVKGYTSKKGKLSHQQWLAQRQVRLTNKKFIQVDVRDFSVNYTPNKFIVTFAQHYRSNTMDDTIRKQLIFERRGDDWNSVKIISEQVIK